MGCERHGNSDAETLLETAMELWPTPCWPLRLEPSRNHREGPMPNGTGPSCFYRAITTYRPVNSSPSAVQKCDHLAHFVIRWIRSRRDMLPHRQEINEYSRSCERPHFCRRVAGSEYDREEIQWIGYLLKGTDQRGSNQLLRHMLLDLQPDIPKTYTIGAPHPTLRQRFGKALSYPTPA
jgi:hypothetical protein